MEIEVLGPVILVRIHKFNNFIYTLLAIKMSYGVGIVI
jgi:hypothetical protein